MNMISLIDSQGWELIVFYFTLLVIKRIYIMCLCDKMIEHRIRIIIIVYVFVIIRVQIVRYDKNLKKKLSQVSSHCW